MKNKIIDYFFYDYEEYLAYRPYIAVLSITGGFALLSSLMAL